MDLATLTPPVLHDSSVQCLSHFVRIRRDDTSTSSAVMLFLCVPPPVTRTCLQLEKIMLDYDEKSVITTYDQTSDKKEVFKGLEVI